MNRFKFFSRKTLKNNKGQGATEYILLLVVVVAVVVIFKDRIKTIMEGKVGELSEKIQQVN
jgi:uncharacterized protein (UPF0333 family)